MAVERLADGHWIPPWVRYQHILRYEWTRQFIQRCRVVDAACGTGYGSSMLLQGGARGVDGFDISTEAIQAARDTYQAEGLQFDVADVTRLPATDHEYDVYVSFETIEHVEDDEGLLREARRILRPGGRFICSTPNRALLDPGTAITDRPFNPFHIREYTLEEFSAALHRHFSTVEFYGQTAFSPRYARVLERAGKVCPQAAVKLHQLRKVAGIPWEKREWHFPVPLLSDRQYEILLAVCTR